MTRKFNRPITAKRGFTLIELLVVITIMALLIMAGAIIYSQVLKKSRDAKRQSDLQVVQNALVLYRTDNGYYPSTLNWTTMSPIQNYLSVTAMSGPQGDVYTYNPGTCTAGQCKTFTVCATLEAASPASYCVNNP